MLKNTAEQDSPQLTIWRMCIVCWTPKATDTYSEYVKLIAFPLQQSLQERNLMFRCTRIACRVILCGSALEINKHISR